VNEWHACGSSRHVIILYGLGHVHVERRDVGEVHTVVLAVGARPTARSLCARSVAEMGRVAVLVKEQLWALQRAEQLLLLLLLLLVLQQSQTHWPR
jgi:hypothetical protein